MKVIAIANQKGGVGKTSTATALAAILNERNYKTLLIDCDQQCNSTDTYNAQSEGVATVYDVLLDKKRISIAEAIQTTENGDILAGDALLRKADQELKESGSTLYRMANAIKELEGFDYVIIDTAPAMNTVLHNCLVAADEIVIPVTADRYSLQGLSQLNETIVAIRKKQNPKLKIAGLLLTRYNSRANLSKEARTALERIAKNMNTKVFDSSIRECTKVKQAQALRKTLTRHASTCTAAQDYKMFVDELIG